MSKCLLDTDILSEILKGKNPVVATKAASYLAQEGRFTTSAISVAEIVYGFRRIGRDDRAAALETSLDSADVLPFDDAAGRVAGRINGDLERRGGASANGINGERLGRCPWPTSGARNFAVPTFRFANLNTADLCEANPRMANLSDADLGSSELHKADLSGAHLNLDFAQGRESVSNALWTRPQVVADVDCPQVYGSNR